MWSHIVKSFSLSLISLFLVLQVHERPRHRPLLCPRFLSHMRAHSEDLRPPCSLSSKSRPQPPSRGGTTSTHTLAALRTQTLDGEAYQHNTWCFHTTRRRLLPPLTPQLCSLTSFLAFSSSPGAVEVEATGLVVSS